MPVLRSFNRLLPIIFLVTIFSLFLPARPAFAGATNAVPTPEPASAKNFRAPQQADYTILNLIHTGLCQGGMRMNANDLCFYKDENSAGKVAQQIPGGGAMGGLSNIMVAMYTTPPTSATQYLADLESSLGLASPAYAQSVQGSGAGVIRPVLKLWQMTRNIAYLFFILIFLVIGFMIMFKAKINPQTVVSIQTALPGLVVGLLLVTFSYFIAAFIVDLSFVAMQLVAFLFVNAGVLGVVNNGTGITDLARTGNVFDMFGNFIISFNWGDFMVNVGKLVFSPAITQLVGNLAPGSNIPVIGNIISRVIGSVLVSPAAFLGGPVISLIILIALLIQMFRLVFSLITSYIVVLVMTVVGPLIILGSSIPGRGSSLSAWWKPLLANVLVFPAVFGAFIFALVIDGNMEPNNFTQSLPLFNGISPEVLKSLLSLGIMLATPSIPGMVKGALGIKDEGGFGKAALAGFMAGASVPQAAAPHAYHAGVQATYDRLKTSPAGTTGKNIATRLANWNRNSKWFNP